MQGDKIAETSGKVTSQRVLPNPGGGPKMESSFAASGKLLGVDETETGTYWAAVRPDGTLYGEGQGIIMGKEGDVATWVGDARWLASAERLPVQDHDSGGFCADE